jgi:hypothetical protein
VDNKTDKHTNSLTSTDLFYIVVVVVVVVVVTEMDSGDFFDKRVARLVKLKRQWSSLTRS